MGMAAFNGLVCFSVLGNMAHTLEVPVTEMIPIEMMIQLIGYLFPRLKAGFRIPTLIVITVAMFVLTLPKCTGVHVKQ
ncbi:hypothetical protein MAR_009990 [Mya arenaria]|nr:hypothetical protein MAR_009990 [Mya arenaria]